MFIVLFEDGKVPQVLHGVNPQDYPAHKILVNPVLPRGVPPHQWKRVKSWIEVIVEEKEAIPIPIEVNSAPELPELPEVSFNPLILLPIVAALAAVMVVLIKVL
jgi:hypothetical protein